MKRTLMFLVTTLLLSMTSLALAKRPAVEKPAYQAIVKSAKGTRYWNSNPRVKVLDAKRLNRSDVEIQVGITGRNYVPGTGRVLKATATFVSNFTTRTAEIKGTWRPIMTVRPATTSAK